MPGDLHRRLSEACPDWRVAVPSASGSDAGRSRRSQSNSRPSPVRRASAWHLGEPIDRPGELIIRDKLRQEDSAVLADVARENVSRILGEWRKRKVIVQQSPSVYVIRKSRLEREARLELWRNILYRCCAPRCRLVWQHPVDREPPHGLSIADGVVVTMPQLVPALEAGQRC